MGLQPGVPPYSSPESKQWVVQVERDDPGQVGSRILCHWRSKGIKSEGIARGTVDGVNRDGTLNFNVMFDDLIHVHQPNIPADWVVKVLPKTELSADSVSANKVEAHAIAIHDDPDEQKANDEQN